MTHLRLTGGAAGHDSRLELDGVDVSSSVQHVTIHVDARHLNRATVSYACTLVEVDGEYHIAHQCPIGGEEG